MSMSISMSMINYDNYILVGVGVTSSDRGLR